MTIESGDIRRDGNSGNQIDNKQLIPEPNSAQAALSDSLPKGQLNVAVRFHGWFNNRMCLLLMMIENVKPRDLRSIFKLEFFLDDIEHHFVPTHSPRYVWGAFRYLKRFLRLYPRIKTRHLVVALKMTARIYEAVGMPVPAFENKKTLSILTGKPTQQDIHRVVREVMKSSAFCIQ